MAHAELRQLQAARLRDIAAHAYERVPFYRQRWDAAEVTPGHVRSLADLRRLPVTRKRDLREHYPFGLVAVGRSELARIHASSGTTGKPTIVAYTRHDLDVFARVVARCLAMAGAEPGMMLHNAYGYGLFTGGLGLHAGAERLGMAVVPASGGMTERQVTLIADLRPEVICATPSYALTLGHALRDRGIAPEDIGVRYAVLGAEPWTDTTRRQVEELLGARAINIFGLSEIVGPGVACECVEQGDGLHVNEDHFLPEILDAETGEPVPDGQDGVLVLTTLTKRALPMIRYWTGDVTSLRPEPCSCGRTLVRIAPIRGRTDDMLIIRGVNVYPTQVEAVLADVPELSAHYRLTVSRERAMDKVVLEVEVDEEAFVGLGSTTENETARQVGSRLAHLIKETIGCSMDVTLRAPGDIPRSSGGKLARVADLRLGG